MAYCRSKQIECCNVHCCTVGTGCDSDNILLAYHTPILNHCKHTHCITKQMFVSFCVTQNNAARKITKIHGVHHQHHMTIL